MNKGATRMEDGPSSGSFGNKPGSWKPRSKQQETKEVFDIVLTHVDAPMKFWACRTSRGEELKTVSDSLQAVCAAASPVTDFNKDRVYAAQFIDETWYRCKVKHTYTEDCDVAFIDYGNTERKKKSDLVEITPNLHSVKAFADLYVLYGLEPEKNCNFQEGKEYMESFIEKRCSAEVPGGARTSVVIPVILSCDGLDINQEFLSKGYGHRRFNKDKEQQAVSKGFADGNKPVDTWKSNQVSVSPGGTRSISGPTPVNAPAWKKPNQQSFRQNQQKPATNAFNTIPDNSNYTGGYHDSSQPSSQIDPLQFSPDGGIPPLLGPASQGYGKHDGSGDTRGGASNVRIAALEKELANAKQEIRILKSQVSSQQSSHMKEYSQVIQERDTSVINAAKYKSKMKEMEAYVERLSSKLSDNSIGSKMNHLVIGLKMVKLLRRQFPTDDQSNDIIQDGISMLTGTDSLQLDNLEVLKSVKSSIDSYSFIQERIRNAQELNDVSELIPARHEARKQLNERLEEFETAVKHLPIDERAAQLKASMDQIKNTYSSFLQAFSDSNTLNIPELSEQYSNWKSQKYTDFQEVRTHTNTCHNSLNSALSLLLQQLSLETESESNDTATSNLDHLLKQFQCDISDEISRTDMLHHSDGRFVAMVCESVTQEISQQLEELQKLKEMTTSYQELRAGILPWLSEKPDVSRIQTVRKTIRGLKSKLRHKLADKADMEELESDEAESGEIDTILQDLSKIRSDLQEAFDEEEELLGQLVEVNENHFPELNLQYTDLGLSQNKGFTGLVKGGRSLDQFDMDEVPKSGSHVKKTLWRGKPIVLKEYIINPTGGVTKQNFIEQVGTFKSVTCPHLVPIKSVFFDKSNRQAYLQMPCYEQNLTNFVNGIKPPDKVIHKISLSILSGLQSLHNAGIVHGSIHPNNIFINDDCSAAIGDFDFSKTLSQRCSHHHTTTAGLSFAVQDSTPSTASDMYYFGLLLIWLHAPDTDQISLTRDPGIAQHMSLKQLLMYLLDPDSSKRCNAEKAAEYPYFTEAKFEESESHADEDGDKLQLRPSPSPKLPNAGGGILKNSNSPQPSSPVSSEPVTKEDAEFVPQTPNDLDDTIEAKESVTPEVDEKCDEEKEEVNEENKMSDQPTNELLVNAEEKEISKHSIYSPDPNQLSKDALILENASLPCTPMGTPVNTPVNLNDSGTGSATTHGVSPIRKLVTEAAKLASEMPSPASTPESQPPKEETGNGKKISSEDEGCDMDEPPPLIGQE